MTAHTLSAPVMVLLAAGEGSRFGGAKQLAEIAGEPMLRRVARILLRADIPLIVVTGAHADAVEAVIDDLPLSMIRCDDWQLGMGQSLSTGMRELLREFPRASGALVCLADQPLVNEAGLRRMLERHAQAPDRILATVQHGGVAGPPALFPRDCFAALSALAGSHGARDLLKQQAARVDTFTFDAYVDVDTPDDLQSVQAWLRRTDPH